MTPHHSTPPHPDRLTRTPPKGRVSSDATSRTRMRVARGHVVLRWHDILDFCLRMVGCCWVTLAASSSSYDLLFVCAQVDAAPATITTTTITICWCRSASNGGGAAFSEDFFLFILGQYSSQGPLLSHIQVIRLMSSRLYIL